MNEPIKLDLDAIEAAAKAATPQDFDSAELKVENGYIECPTCGGSGEVELEGEYTNFDRVAIGVQFYGIGHEFGAAEAYYRAAGPAVVLELIRRLRAADALVAARIVEIPEDIAAVALVGEFKPAYVQEMKAFHNALRDQHNSGALVVCVQSPSNLVTLDVEQMRQAGWVRA